MTLEAVLFDWGGTLSAYADIDLADMWRLAARHFSPDREEEVCRRLTEIEAETFGRAATDQRSSTLEQILARASEELGLDVTDAVRAEAATHYLDSWTPHIVHEPDAAEVLAAIRGRGMKTGMLSNTHWPRAFHEHFLERDGLASFIDVRCYTSELTHTKPHPEAFRAVLSQLGVDDPARAVFVGDRPYDDVLGAKSFGMRAVLRPNPAVPSHAVEPDAVITGLPELIALVERWR